MTWGNVIGRNCLPSLTMAFGGDSSRRARAAFFFITGSRVFLVICVRAYIRSLQIVHKLRASDHCTMRPRTHTRARGSKRCQRSMSQHDVHAASRIPEGGKQICGLFTIVY